MKCILTLFTWFIPHLIYAQNKTSTLRNIGADSVVVNNSMLRLMLKLQDKVVLQDMELHVYQNLQKIDSTWYGKDSLVLSFMAKNGTRIKTMKRTFGGERWGIIDIQANTLTRPLEDSIVTYYSDNGLLVYNEHWDETYKFENALLRTGNVSFYWRKLKYERFEYDNQKRVIKRLHTIPDYRMWETNYTYDAQGKAIEAGKWVSPYTFWEHKWITL